MQLLLLFIALLVSYNAEVCTFFAACFHSVVIMHNYMLCITLPTTFPPALTSPPTGMPKIYILIT